LPKNEEKKLAFVIEGVKNPPSNREKARIELNILSLGFIKQINYRKFSFLIPN